MNTQMYSILNVHMSMYIYIHVHCMYYGTCIMYDNFILFRCFLSAGSPAQSPEKSRVVEAVCSLLLEKYPTAQRGDRSAGSYRSRWKLVVSEYNAIRTSLANSTIQDIALCSINETTLKKWFQDTVRLEEVKILLQGKRLPDPPMCFTYPLPAAQQIDPDDYQPPTDPHYFNEPEDLTGRFVNRRKNAARTNVPLLTSVPTEERTQPSTQPPAPHPSTQPPAPQVTLEVSTQPEPSRTTVWRWRKQDSEPKSRKVYSCRKFGSPMSTPSHIQFHGARYCPQAFPDLTKEDWLEQQRAKSPAKKKKKIHGDNLSHSLKLHLNVTSITCMLTLKILHSSLLLYYNYWILHTVFARELFRIRLRFFRTFSKVHRRSRAL